MRSVKAGSHAQGVPVVFRDLAKKGALPRSLQEQRHGLLHDH